MRDSDWHPDRRSATIRVPHSSHTFEMIAKPYTNKPLHPDRRQRAGAAAENQIAHYLHRAFKQDREVHVLHALRLQDAEQPEQDGSPGVPDRSPARASLGDVHRREQVGDARSASPL